jgi:tyrosinase
MKLLSLQLLLTVCNGLLTGRQTCSNPVTRTEWRDLADSEKSAYIEAVQCLKLTESRLSDTGDDSLYDDFANVHRQLDTQSKPLLLLSFGETSLI